MGARPPREPVRPPQTLRDPAEIATFLEDAAHTPGGHAVEVTLPRTEGEVAWVLRNSRAVLPIGAQSSVTGGATPMGERVLSLSRMDVVGPIGSEEVTVEAGCTLLALEAGLRERGLYYPPAPTFRGATVGGTAATNAAGAATFKYGSTRRWIRAITVVLASGDVLDLERGACHADRQGVFEIELPSHFTFRVPVPKYAMPAVAKRSAGYHAEPEMDLIDLFVGSEGTLGAITRLRLALIPDRPRLLGWATLGSEAETVRLVKHLRDASHATWSSGDPLGIDVAAAESLDRRCLDFLREDGTDREQGVRIDPQAVAALLFQAELPPGTGADAAITEIGLLDDSDCPDTPLTRLCTVLREHGAFDDFQVALPGDARRAEGLQALREAIPTAVNHRLGQIQRTVDPAVHKVAADMIVPFEHLQEMIDLYRQGFSRRGLDHALWGHISDGNLHANAIPRSAAELGLAEEAILEFGAAVRGLRGCPLSEHGVGRNRTKQELLRRLYGDEGIEQMRMVKQALDPAWILSPGTLFPR